MTPQEFFNPKKTQELFGLNDYFTFLKNLILSEKLPNVLMVSGNKGIGKSTLINHILFYIFDNENYNVKENRIINKTDFHDQFLSNLSPNIIYLSGSFFGNIKIDDIRKLKNDLSKSPINDKKRFIILDDVEIFNLNSLNALLKIIEEPGKYNNFILINNKTVPLLDTIKSRCLEIKIFLSDEIRLKIISSLINYFKQEIVLDKSIIITSPGNYLKYNYFFREKKININDKYLTTMAKILTLYKKEKNLFYKDLLIFYSEYYLEMNRSKKFPFSQKFLENKSFIVKNINDFFLYNLNQNTLLNSLESKLLNE